MIRAVKCVIGSEYSATTINGPMCCRIICKGKAFLFKSTVSISHINAVCEVGHSDDMPDEIRNKMNQLVVLFVFIIFAQ